MNIREQYEKLENDILSTKAAHSADSLGRLSAEDKDPVRTEFQRDRDRIIHCKSFRRLKHKTQVFIDPEEDHYRTRLTHTLEVAQISRTISRALRLNEDLTEAIALGHDLGHTPFGHAGEAALNEIYAEYVPGARFRHSEQSLRVVDVLEKDGTGLNLTHEVRDGILHHSKGSADLSLDTKGPSTLEGRVVKISDRVAYINHDIDDAIRAGLISAADLPADAVKVVGKCHSERVGTMVMDVIESSRDYAKIGMSNEFRGATDCLKDYLFAEVYGRDFVAMVEIKHAGDVLKDLFKFYMDHPEEIGLGTLVSSKEDIPALARKVCDLISGMTDRFAQRDYTARFLKWI